MKTIDRIKADVASAKGEWRFVNISTRHVAALVEFYEAANQFAHWFEAYPCYKPNPDMLEQFERHKKAWQVALAALEKEE